MLYGGILQKKAVVDLYINIIFDLPKKGGFLLQICRVHFFGVLSCIINERRRKMSDKTAEVERVEHIIREYADMIYRIALQNLKNTTDAQDVFQEVCLSLLIKNAPLYDDVYIKHWLIRVTINKCKNLRKSVWRTRTQELKPDSNSTCEQDNSALELVLSLPKNYRNVVYLYYFEKYTIIEIAKLLGKSQNTINSQLQRARKKLRKILEDGDN